MTITNICTAFTLAVFVLITFVILPEVTHNNKRHEGDFGQTQDILTPWDELTDAQKMESVE